MNVNVKCISINSNRQFLNRTFFADENLEYLFVDTPPGTSDEHLSIVQYLADAGKLCFIIGRILKSLCSSYVGIRARDKENVKEEYKFFNFLYSVLYILESCVFYDFFSRQALTGP